MLESALLSAFLERCDEISDVEGVVNTYDPCSSIHVTKVDAGGEEDDQMHDDDEDVDEEESTDDDNKTDAEEVEEEDGTNGTDGEVDGSDGDAAGDETDGNEADNIGDTSGLDGTDGDAAASPTGVTQASNERGIESGGKVGIALAGLLVLLLLLLFCFRRKRKADMLKHKQLEQYDGDKTFISGSNNGSPNRGEYKDDDSFMDSRYGMYPEGQSEGMVLGAKSINQDVHKCSSATCKLCEARRQGGLQFLPITGPVKVSNFTHSVREYDTDDTVNL